jgi:hypothetical protein
LRLRRLLQLGDTPKVPQQCRQVDASRCLVCVPRRHRAMGW